MHWANVLYRVLATAAEITFNPIYENWPKKKNTYDKCKLNIENIVHEFDAVYDDISNEDLFNH